MAKEDNIKFDEYNTCQFSGVTPTDKKYWKTEYPNIKPDDFDRLMNEAGEYVENNLFKVAITERGNPNLREAVRENPRKFLEEYFRTANVYLSSGGTPKSPPSLKSTIIETPSMLWNLIEMDLLAIDVAKKYRRRATYVDELAKRSYYEALKVAGRLRKINPRRLPKLPKELKSSDPITGLRLIQDWAIDAQEPQADSGGDTPQGTLYGRIKEIGKKILQLREGEPLQPFKTSGSPRRESHERDAIANAENQAPAKRAYNERVKAVLGDNADDWLFIKRSFRDLYPEFYDELRDLRKDILDHTDLTGKHINWLEPREGHLGPDKNLKSKITLLVDELLHKAEQATTETADGIQPVAPKAVTPSSKAARKQTSKRKWKPPRGHTGSNDIINSSLAELKTRLRLKPKEGDKKLRMPRSTLADRAKKDKQPGGSLDRVTLKKDPVTHEVYYPNSWLKEVLQNYTPRSPKP
ncbi:MAG: hypothetical protein JXM79_18575 [Sedimentisphaerales bacterium]|nr:hypothetical protein [Sedimentisphaerales bacterium]